MRRRILVAAGILVLAVGAAGAYLYLTKHRFRGNVLGSTNGFVSTQTTPAPPAPTPRHRQSIAAPMFGVVPEHLHVGVGSIRPPFKLAWQASGTSLIEFPPAVAFHYLYYATLSGNLIATSARTGQRLWTVHVRRCQAAGPAVGPYKGGTVYETFLNPKPCGAGVRDTANGLLLAISAGRPHTVRWKRNLPASETSPTIVGKRLFMGTAQGDVYCLSTTTGKTIWHFRAGGAVKGAITYDGGKVFFGAYDGRVYALGAGTGKLIWTASAGGHLYSTAAVAYSRVYIGSTDGGVYAFDERNGALAWARGTGSYVYGSPAVFNGHVFVGSYNHVFYALNAVTGNVDWTFPAGGPISGSATVIGGLVYFGTSGVQKSARSTYVLDYRTGKKVWSWHDGGYGAIATDGQKVYITGWGRIYAFEPRNVRHHRTPRRHKPPHHHPPHPR
jgi:outer membrane protein assembly factor BamB